MLDCVRSAWPDAAIASRDQASSLITDCHVHIQPFELVLSPPALELMKRHQPDFDRVLEFTRSPKAFLKYMDKVGLDRAVLINAAAPDVTGFPPGLNAMAANYAKEKGFGRAGELQYPI